ncbi:MAG: PatB family C-S lyase [Muribaculaceae bacterium]|nr:PatB family C-S lyase [Muribaculaceae bacterium]
MGKYNFDEEIERRGSGALKTDRLKERFGREDLLAAWVADMDFATPPFIIDALKKRLDHPIFGYCTEPEDYRRLICEWEWSIHKWRIEPDWISYIPGIVKGIGMVINVFTKPGDPVYILPPVYHPFRISTEMNERKVVNVPLKLNSEGRFKMDFDKLKEVAEGNGPGVLILSNPHNPGGTVWSKEELRELAHICHEKHIIVVSDEIHADMVLWGKQHVPFMTVSQEAEAISITFCAPSKVFNIPGIVASFSVVANEVLRNKFYKWLSANEFNEAPEFSYIATCAAYREGHEWRKEMLEYVEENIKTVEEYFRREEPRIKALRPDASFLVWLDCRELGLSQKDLVNLFINKAHVALNDGSMFGEGGEGFMRLNVGMPRSKVMEVVGRISDAVKQVK